MHPSLKTVFDELEVQRGKLLDQLSGVNAEHLNRRMVEGKWSITEIISHLIVAERLSVQYLRKKIQGIDSVKDSGIYEDMKMLVFVLSQRLPGMRFRAPKVVVENTQHLTELAELRSSWEVLRKELRELLEQFPDDKLKRKIYRHVIVGYINIRQMLIFFREHVIHHQPQILKQLSRIRP